jgi:sec-independent protein translocase protein TatC
VSAAQQTEMPFLDHLEELRWRIIWSLLALAIGFVVGLVLVMRFDFIALIERPIAPYLQGQKLVYTHPGEPFNIAMSVSFAVGMVLAAPVVLYQVWAFLSPALYQHEKRVVIPILFGATMLFLAGVAVSFFVLLPFTLDFLLGFQTASLTPMITAGNYFSFATGMSLALGGVFELPILIVGLTAVGVVEPRTLVKFRRHAFAACFLTAAVITPGDVLTATFVLLGPLYGLYELSIVLSFVVHRRRMRRLRAEESRAAAAESAA